MKDMKSMKGDMKRELSELSHMKLANIHHGLLINFNVTRLKDGLQSFVLESFMLFMVKEISLISAMVVVRLGSPGRRP